MIILFSLIFLFSEGWSSVCPSDEILDPKNLHNLDEYLKNYLDIENNLNFIALPESLNYYAIKKDSFILPRCPKKVKISGKKYFAYTTSNSWSMKPCYGDFGTDFSVQNFPYQSPSKWKDLNFIRLFPSYIFSIINGKYIQLQNPDFNLFFEEYSFCSERKNFVRLSKEIEGVDFDLVAYWRSQDDLKFEVFQAKTRNDRKVLFEIFKNNIEQAQTLYHKNFSFECHEYLCPYSIVKKKVFPMLIVNQNKSLVKEKIGTFFVAIFDLPPEDFFEVEEAISFPLDVCLRYSSIIKPEKVPEEESYCDDCMANFEKIFEYFVNLANSNISLARKSILKFSSGLSSLTTDLRFKYIKNYVSNVVEQKTQKNVLASKISNQEEDFDDTESLSEKKKSGFLPKFGFWNWVGATAIVGLGVATFVGITIFRS